MCGERGWAPGRVMSTVLVVDDDPSIRRTVTINLRAHGYQVTDVGDGRSALQVVAEEAPE